MIAGTGPGTQQNHKQYLLLGIEPAFEEHKICVVEQRRAFIFLKMKRLKGSKHAIGLQKCTIKNEKSVMVKGSEDKLTDMKPQRAGGPLL